ncbi:YopX family protein [Megasphaera sp.]|uniref:YopX family protein n=1 Tax=Megasphaera sp. TaxID=2023260 RepID=UPI00307E6D17
MEPQWIDYRAWHHDKKVMMHVSEIDFRKYRVKGRAKDEVISARFDEVALMPWTTYYDDSDSDVMIYEGDVIEVTRKDMKKRFVIDDEMGVLLARCIADEQYPFVTFDLEMLICDDGRIKVIGNAYENSELLEMKEV